MQNPLTETERLLMESLTLILENEERIKANPIMAEAVTPALGLSFSLFGGGQIPIGLALEGWRDGELRAPCLHCTDKAHVTYISGNPLSGINDWRGYCLSCRRTMDGSNVEVFRQGLRFSSRLKAAGVMNRRDDPVASRSGFVIDTTEPDGEKKEVRLFFSGEGIEHSTTAVFGPKRMDLKALLMWIKAHSN
jgi:hypothetical protein